MAVTLSSLVFNWFILFNHIVQFAIYTEPVTIDLKVDANFETAWLEVSELVYLERFHEESAQHAGWDLAEFKTTFDWLEDEKNLCLDVDNPTTAIVSINRNKEPSPVQSEAHAIDFIPAFKDRWGANWPDRYMLRVKDYHWNQWANAVITGMDAFNISLPMVPCV